VRACAEVLVDCDLGEHPAAFKDLCDAVADDLGRVRAGDVGTGQPDRAFGDLAAMRAEQTRHGSEQRRLARAVRAEHRDDRTSGNVQAQPA
jgi:hypothetical protein